MIIDIVCKDCKKTFNLTGGHAKWYTKRGLELPKRCPECIAKRKEANKHKEEHHGE